MTISRRIARPLLASIFIAEGWGSIRNPVGDTEAAEVGRRASRTGGMNALTVVRLNGAVQDRRRESCWRVGKFPRWRPSP